MESTSASECTATDRSDDGWDSLRNGVGVDGEWDHQSIRGEKSGCGPVRTGMFSFQDPLRVCG